MTLYKLLTNLHHIAKPIVGYAGHVLPIYTEIDGIVKPWHWILLYCDHLSKSSNISVIFGHYSKSKLTALSCSLISFLTSLSGCCLYSHPKNHQQHRGNLHHWHFCCDQHCGCNSKWSRPSVPFFWRFELRVRILFLEDFWCFFNLFCFSSACWSNSSTLKYLAAGVDPRILFTYDRTFSSTRHWYSSTLAPCHLDNLTIKYLSFYL